MLILLVVVRKVRRIGAGLRLLVKNSVDYWVFTAGLSSVRWARLADAPDTVFSGP